VKLGDGRVLAFGGDVRGGGSAEIYKPRTRIWKRVDNPPPGFDSASLAFLMGNSRVLVLGQGQGRTANAASYDTELGWLSIPNPPTDGSSDFAAAQLDADNVLLAGGTGVDGPSAGAAIFSARTGAWLEVAGMPAPRVGASAAPLGNRLVLVVGGRPDLRPDSLPLDSAEIFDPNGGWRPAGGLAGLGSTYQLLPLGAGRALALFRGSAPGIAVYDAATNSWRMGPPRPHPAIGPAVRMADGRVMVIGGDAGTGQGPGSVRPVADVDLYDPVANSWSSVQQLGAPRVGHLAVLLDDGTVLVAGGILSPPPGPGRAPPVRSTEVFGGRASSTAAFASTGIPEPGWIAGGLALLLVGLLAWLGSSAQRRPSRLGAGLGRLALQAGGVIVATWALFAFAHLLVNSRSPGNGAIAGFFYQPLGQLLWEATGRSLTLIAYATLGATVVGLGAAIAVVGLRERRLVGLELSGAVLLVIPTFLLAILVQELQALIFGKTGLIVAAGYGEVNGVQVFWASLVLGIRPATYLYRHARAALERETGEDYVRTAEAKGLDWSEVVRRHLLRAGGSALVATWTNSFRLMIGSLPLVEYFFGYPGLGRILVQSIGISYGERPVVFRGDLAIGLVVTLALILILVEATAGSLQRWLDPRVRALRSAA
jgi:ABC-type dipeptide/oligopeptide/nickel transport system permease component